MTERPSISVITATFPGRETMLAQAGHSVAEQDYDGPVEHIVECDTEREGPAAVRNRAIARATGEWLAFLDDDDLLWPQHLSTLVNAAADHDADVVWPWFMVQGGGDPFPGHRGRQWDPDDPHIFPITCIVRRSAVVAVGGFDPEADGMPDPNDPSRIVAGEDWRLWLRISAAGYTFHHVDDVTWIWRHHGANTSGLPIRR